MNEEKESLLAMEGKHALRESAVGRNVGERWLMVLREGRREDVQESSGFF